MIYTTLSITCVLYTTVNSLKSSKPSLFSSNIVLRQISMICYTRSHHPYTTSMRLLFDDDGDGDDDIEKQTSKFCPDRSFVNKR